MFKILGSFIAASLILVNTAFAGIPKVGDQAPDFSLITLQGQKVQLSELRGKVVLMGMFHICVPCMNQALELEKVRKEINSDRLVVIGINTSGDSKAEVTEYIRKFPKPVDFPYLLDPKMSVQKAYVQRDMPTVVIVDKEGVIQARTPSVGAEQLIPYLKKML